MAYGRYEYLTSGESKLGYFFNEYENYTHFR